MYLDITLVKKHLNLDEDFTDDDVYLNHLIEVVEQSVSTHLNIALEGLETGGGLPPAIIHAMLLMLGTLYSNRESVAQGTLVEMPLGYDYLISLYRNYSDNKLST